MREIKACGVLVVRGNPVESFLLMKHRDRWDLPKGHVDGDESDEQCALRELHEETGIKPEELELIPGFQFTTTYDVQSKRFGERCRKTLVVFLGRLISDVAICPTEHAGYQWFDWNPPHHIQTQTIDPLLKELAQFLQKSTMKSRDSQKRPNS